MGNFYTHYLGGLKYYFKKDEIPYDLSPLEWEPNYGFEEGARKPKVLKLSDAEIESLQIKLNFIGYCAHKLKDLMACRYEQYPMIHRCNHVEHAATLCQREETSDQRKDYERERRLMVRRKRIKEKQREMKAREAFAAAEASAS